MKLYRRIYDEISSAIERGDYPPGSRLPGERDLAEQFEVSRPTIREAMIALETRNIVATRHGSGIYVVGLPEEAPKELDIGAFELTEARRLIEGETAALAATMIGVEELDKLEECTARMEAEDTAAAIAADREFHVTIARATGNAALVATVSMLWDAREKSALARRVFHNVPLQAPSERQDEHCRITAALRAQDPSGARDAMRHHLNNVIEHLLDMTETEAIEEARRQSRARRDELVRRLV